MPEVRRKRRRAVTIKSPREIALMREAGRIVARVHEAVREAIRPGISTAALDALAESVIRKHGAIPSFKGYHGFPATICASINEELVHGIPRPDRILREGDIISIDVGAIYKGYHGDSAWTYAVGEIDEQARRLMEVTEQALFAGIKQARPGNRLMDYARAVQEYVESRGFHVVRLYTGHGIGRSMHEPPEILNYVNPAHPDIKRRFVAGMTLALEPMVIIGTWETYTLADGWTVVSADGSLSAHFEHTIAVTPEGPLILTTLEDE